MEVGRVVRSIDTTYVVTIPEQVYEGRYVQDEDTSSEYVQTFEVEFVDSHRDRVAARASITLPNPKNPEGKAVLVIPPDSLNVKGQTVKETVTLQRTPGFFERLWDNIVWVAGGTLLFIGFLIIYLLIRKR